MLRVCKLCVCHLRLCVLVVECPGAQGCTQDALRVWRLPNADLIQLSCCLPSLYFSLSLLVRHTQTQREDCESAVFNNFITLHHLTCSYAI